MGRVGQILVGVMVQNRIQNFSSRAYCIPRVKKPPYPRPQKLSDPYGDWYLGTAEELLAVPDDKLEWHHYAGYLGPHLPAGTYEESVYFLPGAFKMLREQEHSLELAAPIIGFISKNAAQLEADGLLESSRTEIVECLDQSIKSAPVEI